MTDFEEFGLFLTLGGGEGVTYCLEIQLHMLALALIVFTFILECPDVIPHKCKLHIGLAAKLHIFQLTGKGSLFYRAPNSSHFLPAHLYHDNVAHLR